MNIYYLLLLLVTAIDISQPPYNCVGGNGDVSAVVQKAIDEAPDGSTITFPAANYNIQNIFIDRNNITLKGERGTQFAVSLYTPGFGFLVGIPRTNAGGKKIDASYLYQNPNSAPNSIQYGLRTNGDAYLQSQAGPAMFGSASKKNGYPYYGYWDNTQLTFDLSFTPDPAKPWQPQQPLFGMGNASNTIQSSPFSLWVGNDPQTLLFCFRTADIANTAYTADRQIWISLKGLTPPYNLRLQLDLAGGKYSITSYTGTASTPVPSTFIDSWGATIPFAKGNLNFVPNTVFPFLVGTSGFRGNFGGTTTPLILYGLKINDGINTAAFNPWNRDSNTITFFPPFTPGTVSRLVPIGTGPNQGDFTMPALFLQTQGNNSLVDNVLLDGINIKCANMKGAGVLWGSVLNSEVKNSTIYNGAHAIANATIGANYTLRVTDCRLGGFDCPYFGSYSIFRGDRLTIIGTGRDTFRFLSCDVVLRDVSAGAPAVNANTFMAAYSADYGGSYVLRDILSDCEGDLYATSPIFLEQHAYSPTKAEFTNLNLGASNGPAITLVRKSPLNSTTWLPCQVDIRGMLAGRYKPAVRVIGGVISPVDFVAPDMGPYSLNVGW